MNKLKNKSKCVIALYAIAVVLAVVCVITLISSISYIKTYAATYGMTVSDMGSEAIGYVISQALPYLIYAILVAGLGRVLDVVEGLKGSKACEAAASAPAALEEVPCECAAAPAVEEAEEAWSMAKVPPLYTSKSFMYK